MVLMTPTDNYDDLIFCYPEPIQFYFDSLQNGNDFYPYFLLNEFNI